MWGYRVRNLLKYFKAVDEVIKPIDYSWPTEEEINDSITKNIDAIHNYLIENGFKLIIVNNIVDGKFIFKRYIKGFIETRIYMDKNYSKIPAQETIIVGEDNSVIHRGFCSLYGDIINDFIRVHEDMSYTCKIIIGFGEVINAS